jgi:hypothetical protein
MCPDRSVSAHTVFNGQTAPPPVRSPTVRLGNEGLASELQAIYALMDIGKARSWSDFKKSSCSKGATNFGGAVEIASLVNRHCGVGVFPVALIKAEDSLSPGFLP